MFLSVVCRIVGALLLGSGLLNLAQVLLNVVRFGAMGSDGLDRTMSATFGAIGLAISVGAFIAPGLLLLAAGSVLARQRATQASLEEWRRAFDSDLRNAVLAVREATAVTMRAPSAPQPVRGTSADDAWSSFGR